jgi:hypothetical protein
MLFPSTKPNLRNLQLYSRNSGLIIHCCASDERGLAQLPSAENKIDSVKEQACVG